VGVLDKSCRLCYNEPYDQWIVERKLKAGSGAEYYSPRQPAEVQEGRFVVSKGDLTDSRNSGTMSFTSEENLNNRKVIEKISGPERSHNTIA
jgi:hypothetical protein